MQLEFDENKNLDVNELQYPLQLTLVRLCDGSTAYILSSLLGDLEGPYVVLGNITVTGPGQTFQVLATPKEPIFAMSFSHEANGNIKRAIWQVTHNQPQYYDYSYDPLNRLNSGLYGRVVPLYNLSGVFTKFSHILNNNYNENNLTYDLDGNIKTLNRFGMVPNASCFTQAQIDVLGYTYLAGTPKLQKIADTAPTANRAKGFNPGTASSSAVYQYDKNGNLTTDPYKGITIQYNFLNLPRLVTKGGANIVIRYDASGRKWSQTGTEGVREYVGGIEYLDQKIQSVQHGEGRLIATYNTGGTAIETIRAEYWRQDHLGNTRVAFSDFNLDGVIVTKDDPNTTGNDIEITQENHYYPFGLNHEGPWYQTVAPKNRYLFNGIERNEDLELNWDLAIFRSYDAAIGRWMQVDPAAENYREWSPYNYVLNNPGSNTDPLGDTVRVYTETVESTGNAARHTFIRVTTDTRDVIVELWGPNKDVAARGTGVPQAREVEDENQIFGRNNVKEHIVTRPENSPEGDSTYGSFENQILVLGAFFAEYVMVNENGQEKKDFVNVPVYEALGPNSNGFANAIIEMAGGSVNLPWNAPAQNDTQVYKKRVNEKQILAPFRR